MRYSRYASICLALILAASLLASCGHRGQDGADTQNTENGSVTVEVGGAVITPSEGDASVTAKPETAPETIPATEPSAGDYTPAGETVITLGNAAAVEG